MTHNMKYLLIAAVVIGLGVWGYKHYKLVKK